MNNTELLGRINALSKNALGSEDSELSSQRAKAFDHYHGRPYGDEQEGRSKIVDRSLSETVDWIMPSLMKVFFHSGIPVEFDPVGKEDELVAQQESDYVNYVITNRMMALLFSMTGLKMRYF